MPSGPIHLHIADVLTAVPAQVGVEAGLVMLTEDDEPFRSLRIIIGQPEANAILAGWHGAVPGRPSTWDLFVSTVALLGARLDRVVITAVHEERHYYAHIELEHDGERRILACRPSDAIALAVRGYNVDIMAEPSVLDAAGVMPDGSKPGKPPEPAENEPAARLAEREAALAAREAELAARERALLDQEGGTSPQSPGGPDAAGTSLEEAPAPAPEPAPKLAEAPPAPHVAPEAPPASPPEAPPPAAGAPPASHVAPAQPPDVAPTD